MYGGVVLLWSFSFSASMLFNGYNCYEGMPGQPTSKEATRSGRHVYPEGGLFGVMGWLTP